MKYLSFLFIIAVISCNTSKRSVADEKKKAAVDITTVVARDNQSGTVPTVPACITELIKQFKAEEVQNPPRKIFQYMYNGELVFYVPPICCDFFSDLYNRDCKSIGHPDGGFTGRGDGTVSDFLKTRSDKKLVWQDDRK